MLPIKQIPSAAILAGAALLIGNAHGTPVANPSPDEVAGAAEATITPFIYGLGRSQFVGLLYGSVVEADASNTVLALSCSGFDNAPRYNCYGIGTDDAATMTMGPDSHNIFVSYGTTLFWTQGPNQRGTGWVESTAYTFQYTAGCKTLTDYPDDYDTLKPVFCSATNWQGEVDLRMDETSDYGTSTLDSRPIPATYIEANSIPITITAGLDKLNKAAAAAAVPTSTRATSTESDQAASTADSVRTSSASVSVQAPSASSSESEQTTPVTASGESAASTPVTSSTMTGGAGAAAMPMITGGPSLAMAAAAGVALLFGAN